MIASSARHPEYQRLAYTGGAELAVTLDAVITGGQLTIIDNDAPRGHASRSTSIAATTRRSC
jgi:hypothetical protein